MSKEIAKKAVSAGFEKTVLALLPGLEAALTAIRSDITRLDMRIEHLSQKIDDKVDQLRDTINEVGLRVIGVDGKFEGFIMATRQQSASTKELIERVVRLEKTRPASKRKAG